MFPCISFSPYSSLRSISFSFLIHWVNLTFMQLPSGSHLHCHRFKGILYAHSEGFIPCGVQIFVYCLGFVGKLPRNLELHVGITGAWRDIIGRSDCDRYYNINEITEKVNYVIWGHVLKEKEWKGKEESVKIILNAWIMKPAQGNCKSMWPFIAWFSVSAMGGKPLDGMTGPWYVRCSFLLAQKLLLSED